MNKGSKHTLETRKKISLNNAHSMLGKRPWNWGLTKETDERVGMQSESIKGRKITTEQKKKISNANKGREKTREEKLKISIALKKRFENKENHPMYGKPRPKELMKRIGLKNKGRKNSKDAIKRMSKSQKLRYAGGKVVWNKGKKLSEEHIKNLSISHLGHIPWNKGKKGVYSKEIIERFRKNNVGKKHTKETKKKMSLSQKKRIHFPHSEEAKKKIGIMSKGRIHSEKSRKRIAMSLKGRKFSEEHKIKLKIARAKQIFPIKDTTIEVKIQNFLSLLHLEFYTHKYISEIEHSYQCDILIPKQILILSNNNFIEINKKTIIECDGCYWHSCPICKINYNKEGIEKDNVRTKELQKKGFKVLRLWEHDINSMRLIDFKIKLNKIGGKI